MTEQQPDPLAGVRVGDPDPTPDVPPGECCGLAWDDATNAPFCTREPGHPGQHIAGDGPYGVVAVLPVADEQPPAPASLREQMARELYEETGGRGEGQPHWDDVPEAGKFLYRREVGIVFARVARHLTARADEWNRKFRDDPLGYGRHEVAEAETYSRLAAEFGGTEER